MAKAKTNSNVTVNPEMMEMFNAFMQFMANNSNNGISEEKTATKKSNAPAKKDFSNDLEYIKKDGKWYVMASKYVDGKKKGERKVFSKSRLNHLAELCEELTKGNKKAVLTRPEKIGRGKWVPFYITCNSEALAKSVITKHSEAMAKWYETASAEEKKNLDKAIPDFLR